MRALGRSSLELTTMNLRERERERGDAGMKDDEWDAARRKMNLDNQFWICCASTLIDRDTNYQAPVNEYF